MKEFENTKNLNAVERADAIARIARHIGKREVKPENLTMDFGIDEDNGKLTVAFVFSKELNGFNTFDGTKFVDIPDMKLHIKVASPLDELNDYSVATEFADSKAADKIPEQMRQPLLGKVAYDVRMALLEVSLLPFTRNKSKSDSK